MNRPIAAGLSDVARLAQDLSALLVRKEAQSVPRSLPRDTRRILLVGLASGLAGRLLALAESSEVIQDQRLFAAAGRAEQELLKALEETALPPSYLDGIFGAVWSLASVARLRGSAAFDFRQFVEAAVDALSYAHSWPLGILDLGGGLAGAMLVVADIGEQVETMEFLDRAVAVFEAAARKEPGSEGIYWARTQRMPDSQLEEDVIDLGVGHGTPGIVGALIRVGTRHRCLRARVTALVRSAVDFVLSTRSHGTQVSEFPTFIVRGKPEFPSRLAWCYGDPGVAAVLADAGRFLGDPVVLNEAREVAVRAAQRVLSRSEPLEHCLCHGMAGLLVIFRKLSRHFADPELAAAANMLREELIEWGRRDLAAGRQPYPCEYYRSADGTNIWPENDGLLFGMSGVLLALLAELNPGPRWWMYALLLDDVDSPPEMLVPSTSGGPTR